MPISRLATANPGAATFGSGNDIYVATGTELVSVIATNTETETKHVFIYTVATGDESTPNNWGVIAYSLPISGYNTYETFRFAMNVGDTLYVAGSAGVRYFVQGISQ